MCCFSGDGTVAQVTPWGLGGEKGIVLSTGWLQYPLTHQSCVQVRVPALGEGLGLGQLPWGWRGAPLPPDLGTRTEPWPGQCSAQLRGGLSIPGPAPGTAQRSQPSPSNERELRDTNRVYFTFLCSHLAPAAPGSSAQGHRMSCSASGAFPPSQRAVELH